MEKALVITSVASMVDQFLMPSIILLQNMGYDVQVACNFEKGCTCSEERIKTLKERLAELNVTFFQIDFARNVIKANENYKAYKQTAKIIKDNNYRTIHCHSPIGGLITRLVARKTRKKETKVIYTAHGFHFYKGAPVLNWLLYYPVEWFCSFFTDTLITINKEDFELAKRKFHAKKTVYVPGVGIDTEKIAKTEVDIEKKRKEIGVCENDVVVLSVGELNDNKNHEAVLRAIAKLENQNATYAICGRGEYEEKLKELAKELGVEDKLKLLGYRNDVAEIMKCSDIFAFPSKREGLPVSVMEAMSASLPVVCSKIRGNTDLIVDGEGGFLCIPDSVEEFKEKIEMLISDKEKRIKMGEINKENVKKFDIENVKQEMKEIYGI